VEEAAATFSTIFRRIEEEEWRRNNPGMAFACSSERTKLEAKIKEMEFLDSLEGVQTI
jgi:hypothetical protein